MREYMVGGVHVHSGDVGELRPVSWELRHAASRLADMRAEGVFRLGTPLGRQAVQEHATLLMALVERVRDLEMALRPLSRRELGAPTVTDPEAAGALAASGATSRAMTCAVVSLAELWAGDTFRDGGDEADEAIGAVLELLVDWADDAAFLEGAERRPAVARMEARLERRWGRVTRLAAGLARRLGRRAAA